MRLVDTDRAQFALSTFTMTEQNGRTVAQICNRLDGIPLAIELAAARVKSISVKRIAERLTDRFRLLTGGSRTALRRHQTLRNAIDWSYDLLSEQERMVRYVLDFTPLIYLWRIIRTSRYSWHSPTGTPISGELRLRQAI